MEKFQEIVISALFPWIQPHGFLKSYTKGDTSVFFQKSNCILGITYYPEDAPNYHLMVNLGFQEKDHLSLVGLWYAAPETSPKLLNAVFSDTNSLIDLIKGPLKPIIETFAIPLFEKPEILNAAIKNSQADYSRQQLEEKRASVRRYAEAAWNQKKYQETINFFNTIREYLSDAEVKKLEYCKKQIRNT